MIKKNLIILSLMLTHLILWAQSADNSTNTYNNAADELLMKDSKLLLGGYGEVHYNQPLNGQEFQSGKLDVHRMVMLLGYNFSERVQFVSEIEFEHVSEVYVEQAFLQYKLNNYLIFRGGLLLVPMGIINEYHEPTTFNGVERPLIDNSLTPTTWREIGLGLAGQLQSASLKYQLYAINGFNGYDGAARLNGKDGLRKGRQKGAESYISAPNFTGKIEYYGIAGLNLGLSGYVGNTQSKLYDGIDKSDDALVRKADSSVVGLSMLGVDARYNLKGLQLRGQLYYAKLSNSEAYNEFTSGTNGQPNDLGSGMLGYYAEAGYDVFRSLKTDKQLIPFVRYEFLNTHHSVASNIVQNAAYEKQAITAGLTLKLAKGAVAKADMQFIRPANESTYAKTLNVGIGVMF